MKLDLRSGTEGSGRAASAALPPTQQARSASPGLEVGAHRPTANRLACDVCGRARARDERYRIVWERDSATRLVLAEVCRDCATAADPLLELYGGCGREAISLVQEIRALRPPRTRVQPRALSYTARGVLYLLIAVAAFSLVTLITSWGR
jgi:hypothetical protein